MTDMASGEHHKKSHFDGDEIKEEEGGEENIMPGIRNFIQLPGQADSAGRGIGQGEDAAVDEGFPAQYIYRPLSHGKSSQEQDYSPPTPNPTPYPTASPVQGGNGIGGSFMSLKNLHQGNTNGIPADLVDTVVHQKQSKEKNGKNPDELPEGWTTSAPTKAPTDDQGDEDGDGIQRVNAAPGTDDDGNFGKDEGLRDCRSHEGGIFGDNRQSSKNGGVVLRYQYELIQDLTYLDSNSFENEVLPLLEQAISDSLLPTFFPEECQPFGGGENVGSARGLISNAERKNGGSLRTGSAKILRDLQEVHVVGLSGAPPDFPPRKNCPSPALLMPLSPTVCNTEYTPLDPNLQHTCYVMEGALTIYFPPNFSASTLLSATTLTTLKSIHQGMANGSIASNTHPSILQLVFLESSYSLMPILPDAWKANEGALGDRGVQGNKSASNGGAIAAGILVPLLLLMCCAAGGFVWWRRQQDKLDNDDDEDNVELQQQEVDEEDHSQVVIDEEGNEVRTLQDRILLWARFRQKQEREAKKEMKAEKKAAKGKSGRRRRRATDSSMESSLESSAKDHSHSITSSSAADSSFVESMSSETDTDTDGDDDTSTDGSTTDGSTTDGSTTDENNSTTSSSSSSSSSSDDEDTEEEGDDVFPSHQFDLGRDLEMLANPNNGGSNAPYSRRRRNRGGNNNRNNIVIGGTAEDESSVATGMTGVSEATELVSNRYVVGGGGGDDLSVGTGATGIVSEATAKISNRNRR